MPVYEYVCQSCSNAFEELVRGDERVACPECESQRVEKRFSTFATSGSECAAAAQPSPGGCGTCGDPRGPGACAV
jgi:putative FmdB family regulatory protein